MFRKITFKSLRIFVQSIGGIRRTEIQYSFLKDTLVKKCLFFENVYYKYTMESVNQLFGSRKCH